MNRTKRIFPITLILLSFMFGACRSTSPDTAAAEKSVAVPTPVQEIEVKTATAIIREMPTYFEATGSLAGDAQTDVSPIVAGRVLEINFDVGSYVQKGSVLLRLDDRDAKLRLDQAIGAAKQAEAGVAQARAILRQAQARLGVKDGEVFDIERYSQVRSTRAQLDLAEKEVARYEKLLETGDVSRSAYDQRKTQRDQLLAQLDEARAVAAIAVRAITSGEEGVRTAEAAVVTARVQVEQARKALADTTIYAPISGYVAERVADIGEYVNPNTPNSKICTIVRTAILRMKIDIPEQNITAVRVGQSVSLQTSAHPDRNFAGTIARISPSVNVQSRTLIVEAEVDNSGGMLKPGEFATVRITQGKARPTVMIPSAAVRSDGDIARAFVVREGRAEERVLKLGLLEGELIEVQQGIEANEKVAITNLGLLSDGISVRE